MGTVQSEAAKSKTAAETVQLELKPILQLIAKEFEAVDEKNSRLEASNKKLIGYVEKCVTETDALNEKVIAMEDANRKMTEERNTAQEEKNRAQEEKSKAQEEISRIQE